MTWVRAYDKSLLEINQVLVVIFFRPLKDEFPFTTLGATCDVSGALCSFFVRTTYADPDLRQ